MLGCFAPCVWHVLDRAVRMPGRITRFFFFARRYFFFGGRIPSSGGEWGKTGSEFGYYKIYIVLKTSVRTYIRTKKRTDVRMRTDDFSRYVRSIDIGDGSLSYLKNRCRLACLHLFFAVIAPFPRSRRTGNPRSRRGCPCPPCRRGIGCGTFSRARAGRR